MDIVVDSNVLVVLVSGDPRRAVARAAIERWRGEGRAMHAPELLPYEVASALTRLVAAGNVRVSAVPNLWETVQKLPITYHPMTEDLPTAVRIAGELARRSAYDAAYLALADRLGAEPATFDGPLARNARSIGRAVTLLDERESGVQPGSPLTGEQSPPG